MGTSFLDLRKNHPDTLQGLFVIVEDEAEKIMFEFGVLATFAVIGAIYIGLFLAAEKFFMK